jgi:hypothetical protein
LNEMNEKKIEKEEMKKKKVTEVSGTRREKR